MTEGLSRRRRAQPGTVGNISASGSVVGGTTAANAARTSADGGDRVACDPRDLVDKNDKSIQPPLNLLEEVVLLGIKDRQGYLSFWNDNISYALRGCVLIELVLRGKIQMQSDPSRRRLALIDRLVEVVDDSITEDVILDEALRMMKNSSLKSVESWMDLMSGETWNIMKIGNQLKQVRERVAKGLVDKGILTTEKMNFLFFDMATHPITQAQPKLEIRQRIVDAVSANSVFLPDSKYFPGQLPLRALRTVCLVCSAHAANVLENVLTDLSHQSREEAFRRAERLTSGFGQWPFDWSQMSDCGDIADQARTEVENAGIDLRLEVVAAVFEVFLRLDSII